MPTWHKLSRHIRYTLELYILAEFETISRDNRRAGTTSSGTQRSMRRMVHRDAIPGEAGRYDCLKATALTISCNNTTRQKVSNATLHQQVRIRIVLLRGDPPEFDISY
jgi:hypothetical protein